MMIKKIPGRHYNKNDKTWCFSREHLSYFVQAVGEENVVIEEESDDVIPPGFVFKTPPYKDFQLDDVKFLLSKDIGLNFNPPGLGKTWEMAQVVSILHYLGHIQKCLVITKANLIYDFMYKCNTHTFNKACVIDGTEKKRIKIYKNIENMDELFYIMGYEMYRTDCGIIRELPFDIVLIDEAHKIKDGTTKIGIAIHFLAQNRKYSMTGTPIVNHPLELYNLLKWVGLEKREYSHFRNKYCKTQWVEFPVGYDRTKGEIITKKRLEIVEYKNLDELHSRIKPYTVRNKEDVLGLPPVLVDDIRLMMKGKQLEMYNMIKMDLKKELIDQYGIVASNPLTKLLRLKQVLDSTEIVCPEYKDSCKLDYIKDYVPDHDFNQGKLLIFSQFVPMCEIIMRELKDKYFVVLYLGTSHMTKKQQRESENLFKEGDAQILVGTSSACREGLDFYVASTTILVDLEWSPEYIDQLIKRMVRMGQDKPTIVKRLTAIHPTERSVDEKMISDVLFPKKMYFDEVVEGEYTKKRGNMVFTEAELTKFLLQED